MNWINQFFYIMGMTALTGSISTLILIGLNYVAERRNNRLFLIWLKTTLFLYLLPIAYGLIRLSRMDYIGGRLVWVGDFGTSTTPAITTFFTAAGAIWLLGMGVGVIVRILQYRKLRNTLRGNVPVESKEWLDIIAYYKEEYATSDLQLYQNDAIRFPITVSSLRPKIILPFETYTEKQRHMVMEHELHHVRNRDLLWKKIGLFVTLIHWWNPLVYRILNQLILREEIECDIQTCQGCDQFTAKEYGMFLAGIDEGKEQKIFASALCESKKEIKRRLEGMMKGRKTEKPKKWIALGSCMMLVLLSVAPSYAAAEPIVNSQEAWIYDTEVENDVSDEDGMIEEVTEDISAEVGVTEEDLSEEGISVVTNAVTLDYTVKANTRVLYGYKKMQAGDEVVIAALCSDKSITYRIGIKNQLGTVTYIEGDGNLTHSFTVEEAGNYSAYVENRSNVSLDVEGTAWYLE